jgi:hypothetical protein
LASIKKIVTILKIKILFVTSKLQELYSMINIMVQTYFLAFTGGQSYKSDDKFLALKKILGNYGIFQTDNFDTNIYISINHNSSTLESFLKSDAKNKLLILIRLEPFVVFPAQYSKNIEAMYTLVITPGSVADFTSRDFFVGWPHSFQANPASPTIDQNNDYLHLQGNSKDKSLEIWKKRKISCSMIAANKVSPIAAANYSLRRFIAMNSSPELLEVYGPLWNESIYKKLIHRLKVVLFNLRNRTCVDTKSIYGDLFRKYKTAKGFVPNKYSILSESRFSLVIENCMEYVSEKLLDTIYAGSIPIYLGPRLEDVGLPSGIAFQLDRYSINAITNILKMEDERILSYLGSGQSFLQSDQYRNFWTENSVYTKIADKIFDFTQGKR